MPQQNVTVFVANLPPQSIIMWFGTAAAVPDGWQICNGAAGTPDLRSRFPMGASSSNPVGTTGGEATHTLSIAEMPAHSHSVSINGTWGVNYGGDYINCDTNGSGTTGSAGLGSPHNNLPPFMTLHFIMKMT